MRPLTQGEGSRIVAPTVLQLYVAYRGGGNEEPAKFGVAKSCGEKIWHKFLKYQ